MSGKFSRITVLILRTVLLLIFSNIATTILLANSEPIPPLMYCLATASSTLLVAYLLAPVERYHGDISAILLWSGITSIVAYITLLHGLGISPSEWRFGLLAGGVFIVALLFGCLHMLGYLFLNNHHITRTFVITLVTIFSLSPIWLGPLVYLYEQHELLVTASINISPISYLAGLADYDYLRNAWFYANTPYGGIRYAYLSQITLTLCYLLVCLLCITFARLYRRDIHTNVLSRHYRHIAKNHQGA